MKRRQQRIGLMGEDIATEYLIKNQHQIIDRNYRTKRGEVDIICQFENPLSGENILVFVEVKARQELQFGLPMEALTSEKMDRVQRAAEVYIMENNLDDVCCRFDVIGIVITPEGHQIEHVQDVLDY